MPYILQPDRLTLSGATVLGAPIEHAYCDQHTIAGGQYTEGCNLHNRWVTIAAITATIITAALIATTIATAQADALARIILAIAACAAVSWVIVTVALNRAAKQWRRNRINSQVKRLEH